MEPSFLLGTFTALVDRIINLEKTKLQDKRDLFREIVNPLFDELEPVVLNYMSIFRKVRQDMATGSRKDLKRIFEIFSEDRDGMKMARLKVRAMADQIKQHVKDKDIVYFAAAVNDFFYVVDRGDEKALASSAYWLLKIIDDATKKADRKREIERIDNYISLVLGKQEQSWSTIVKSYEKIKIYSVTSPRQIKNYTK